MTEFNAQLFEGSQTSDINSGLWLTSALLEMMGGGLDFATQWDSFTQKQDKGGGHGFMYVVHKLPILFPRYLPWVALLTLTCLTLLCANSLMRQLWCQKERLGHNVRPSWCTCRPMGICPRLAEQN